MRFTAQAMQLRGTAVQHCFDEMLQAGRSLSGRLDEVLPSRIHDVNVDVVRRLISTALGLLIRRLCSVASLDAADENLAIHERGLENIRVGETAELQKTASDMHKVKIPAQPRTVTGNHKRLPSAVRMCSPVGE